LQNNLVFFNSNNLEMNNYSLLKEVINLVEEFENKNDSQSFELQDFISWTTTKIYTEKLCKVADDQTEIKEKLMLNAEISRYIFRLNRFASNYTKDFLTDLPLISLNDFVFVAQVHQFESITKTDLIKSALMDKSPGMEIIKRLIAKNIFEEFENKEDKRSKKIRLTSFGFETIFKTYDKMTQVSDIVCADMGYETKLNLLETLKYLDKHHQNIYNSK
jgi:MarR family transcriptional regulator, lower aerobic nicotinate degradation pathway regulator